MGLGKIRKYGPRNRYPSWARAHRHGWQNWKPKKMLTLEDVTEGLVKRGVLTPVAPPVDPVLRHRKKVRSLGGGYI